MSKRSGNGTPARSRDERLREALRANLLRRKAQARARATADDISDITGTAAAPAAEAETGRDES
ncbi:hypothetical protein KY389_06540 [Paracoccus bogoriensis]|uniref:hypothetical protein n=1 Tax=Paracoccus bogoriensis TaxID=242065 RepID=UPI001CA4A5FA|nr:hypothetical protein [Paracoccus bogoriensis]MBW7056353.1 hypothetical protein [Paracoccus bogoriensis]